MYSKTSQVKVKKVLRINVLINDMLLLLTSKINVYNFNLFNQFLQEICNILK